MYSLFVLAMCILLQLETSRIDHICIEYDHMLTFTNHESTLLRFWFIYKA